MNYNGEESKKEYIKLSHFVVYQKVTQCCKSTILQFKFFLEINAEKVLEIKLI